MIANINHILALLSLSAVIVDVSSRPLGRLRNGFTTPDGQLEDSNDSNINSISTTTHDDANRLGGNFLDLLKTNYANQGNGPSYRQDNIDIDDNGTEDDDTMGLMEALDNAMQSMPLTPSPSNEPSISTMPSADPSESVSPSSAPSLSSSPSSQPSVSSMPSSLPSTSMAPSEAPSGSMQPSETPSVSVEPMPISAIPSVSTSPSSGPSISLSPTFATEFPSVSTSPSSIPSESMEPSLTPSVGVTSSPTLSNCPGITEDERISDILLLLVTATNSSNLTDITTPQGLATFWILDQDEFNICPDDPKLVQRWTLAVFYYSTEGDTSWTSCFDGDTTCTVGSPFLAPVNECEWNGITCDDITLCTTRIEFEAQGLAGTIATELGLLSDLTFLGLEQGTTSGTIPSQLGQLVNLTFIDLDFNQLSGTLSEELFTLSNLATLDLNDNELTGNLDGLQNLISLTFVQVENNLFTGPLPTEIGDITRLTVFTLNNNNFDGIIPTSVGLLTELEVLTLNDNDFGGVIPVEVCALRGPPVNAVGVLDVLSSDCGGPTPDIICDCCTACTTPTP